MPTPSKGFFSNIPKTAFRITGFHFNSLLKFGAVLLVAVAGIGWTLLHTGSEQDAQPSYVEGAVSTRSNEEKFKEVSEIPGNFSESLRVEKLSILNSKIKIGEELVNSGDSYADRTSEILVFLYGTRCGLEELEGLNSKESYGRLAELRQEALEAGNEQRAATVNLLCAVAATNRLTRRAERADFRFAADAILNLDSSKLLNLREAQKLYTDAIGLHAGSSHQDNTAIFLSLLADKLISSPVSAISDLGLKMKDYPTYFRYYDATGKLPYSTRESKLKFFKELFSEVQRSPPQASDTYRLIVRLLDRLVNKSDLQTASLLAGRLSEVAAKVKLRAKVQVDESIKNIETRIAAIGKTIDLSGAIFDGSALQMPNGKRTTVVFWRPSVVESANHLRLLNESEWFDPWESNVLVACSSPLTKNQLIFAGEKMSQFKVLDNATSRRLAAEFGIDLVPYEVSLDKDGKVIRLGGVTN